MKSQMLRIEADIFWNFWGREKYWEEKGTHSTLMADSWPKVTFIIDQVVDLIKESLKGNFFNNLITLFWESFTIKSLNKSFVIIEMLWARFRRPQWCLRWIQVQPRVWSCSQWYRAFSWFRLELKHESWRLGLDRGFRYRPMRQPGLILWRLLGTLKLVIFFPWSWRWSWHHSLSFVFLQPHDRESP